jgi:hypothetical protein
MSRSLAQGVQLPSINLPSGDGRTHTYPGWEYLPIWTRNCIFLAECMSCCIMFLVHPAELFEATGAGGSAALLNTVIIGAVNVASTVVAVLVVDK